MLGSRIPLSQQTNTHRFIVTGVHHIIFQVYAIYSQLSYHGNDKSSVREWQLLKCHN